jgi:pimeloyl-ACP methyl ester carboxylesterase
VRTSPCAADVDHRDALPGIDLPVLIVHGRHDRKTRYEGAAYLAEHLRDARLVTFDDSAHCPHLEEAERFNEVLLGFLRELSSPGSAAPWGRAHP